VWKNKPFPHYWDLCIIFGKDRATGKDAQTPADVIEEIGIEGGDGNAAEDVYCSLVNETPLQSENEIPTPTEECSSIKRNPHKKRKISEPIIQGITDAAAMIANQIKASTEIFSKVISVDFDLFEAKKKVNEEIKKLPGITMSERFKAIRNITQDDDKTIVFFTIADDEKEEWVKAVLNGDI